MKASEISPAPYGGKTCDCTSCAPNMEQMLQFMGRLEERDKGNARMLNEQAASQSKLTNHVMGFTSRLTQTLEEMQTSAKRDRDELKKVKNTTENLGRAFKKLRSEGGSDGGGGGGSMLDIARQLASLQNSVAKLLNKLPNKIQ